MDFETQLAQYRQAFAKKEADVKAESQGAQAVQESPDAIWADEIVMPQPGLNPLNPEMIGAEVEMPEVLRERDERWGDDAEANQMAFQQYFESDPLVQQYGPEMEALIEEIIAKASDPSDPLTGEEAQKLFLEMMEEQFSQYFQ